MRSSQIHTRFDEIPSNLERFLANRDEKSLVWPDLVFIVPKMLDLSEKWSESGKKARIWKKKRPEYGKIVEF